MPKAIAGKTYSVAHARVGWDDSGNWIPEAHPADYKLYAVCRRQKNGKLQEGSHKTVISITSST